MFKSLARRILTPTLMALSVMTFASTPSHAADQKRAVVELFTSQGCSSCPPADKILADYAQSKDVLALSWHVDYWNYLGWKDTFSKAEFTNRQRLYAAAFKRRGVYTPQAVVNGRNHVVGSSRTDITKLIDTYEASNRGLSSPLKIKETGDTIHVVAQAGADVKKATLWMVYFDKSHKVKIKRGENRGETITYHNVVRDVAVLGMASNGAIDVTLPKDVMRMKGYDSCAILLQTSSEDGLPGAIIGASVINDLAGS